MTAAARQRRRRQLPACPVRYLVHTHAIRAHGRRHAAAERLAEDLRLCSPPAPSWVLRRDRLQRALAGLGPVAGPLVQYLSGDGMPAERLDALAERYAGRRNERARKSALDLLRLGLDAVADCYGLAENASQRGAKEIGGAGHRRAAVRSGGNATMLRNPK